MIGIYKIVTLTGINCERRKNACLTAMVVIVVVIAMSATAN
jgi:hypothetical protein